MNFWIISKISAVKTKKKKLEFSKREREMKKITTWASTHPGLVWWRSLGAGDGDGLAGTPVSVRQESVVRVFKIRLVYRRKVVALVKVSWGFKVLDHDKKKKKKDLIN